MVRRYANHHCSWCDVKLTEGEPVWIIKDRKGRYHSYSCFHHKHSDNKAFTRNRARWEADGYTMTLVTYGHQIPPSQFKEWVKKRKDTQP